MSICWSQLGHGVELKNETRLVSSSTSAVSGIRTCAGTSRQLPVYCSTAASQERPSYGTRSRGKEKLRSSIIVWPGIIMSHNFCFCRRGDINCSNKLILRFQTLLSFVHFFVMKYRFPRKEGEEKFIEKKQHTDRTRKR